jgi:RND family efflux transporter MFP subunit
MSKESNATDLKGELASLRIDRERPAERTRRWPLLLLLPVLLALGLLYALRVRAAFSAAEVETAQIGVQEAGVATPGTPVLTASGYVVARRKAVVSAKIQGRLAQLSVDEGSRVREGQVIARLESRDYEAQVERARASLERADADLAESRRQLDLARRLAAEKIMAIDQLQATESRVRVSEAAVSQARADLSYARAQLANTVILAPFTGIVVKKMAEVGESVAPIPPGVNLSTSSGAVVALADLDTLEVEADVSESNVAKLSADQRAEVTVEAFPGRRYRGVLRQVIPTADRTKATVQVKVTILDKDRDLKPEMSSKVTFLEREQAASPAQAAVARIVLVPREAVATRDGRSVAFEVREGKVLARPLALGGERDGQVVVKEGLSGGETVVLRPPATLREGDAVRVKR